MVRLVAHRIWEPKGGKGDMDPMVAVLPWILGLRQRGYRIAKVAYDPYNFVSASTMGRKAGLHMEEVPQTPANQTEFTKALTDAVRYGSLRVYRAPDLRQHVLNAVLHEDTQGHSRLMKAKQRRKVDAAVALAMALWAAEKKGGGRPSEMHDTLGILVSVPISQRDTLQAIYGADVPRRAIDKDRR